MDLEFIQKVTKNGSSAVVVLRRSILHRMQLRPGDFVQLLLHDDDTVTLQPWYVPGRKEVNAPGAIPPSAPEVKR